MKIKSVIKERGFTLVQVATQMGITKGAMSQIVNGNPNITTLRKIANIIGCQITDFFRDESEPKIYCPYCGKAFSIHPLKDES